MLDVSIPLSRDSLCNWTRSGACWLRGHVSIPLSRDSLCNYANKDMLYVIYFEFQSLCRGTAFATEAAENLSEADIKFQSLCRGTAFATMRSMTWYLPSLVGFNPSVEGQPLQPKLSRVHSLIRTFRFQSLCRGTAFATSDVPRVRCCGLRFQSLCRGTAFATAAAVSAAKTNNKGFNPSVEGQPLQQEIHELSR